MAGKKRKDSKPSEETATAEPAKMKAIKVLVGPDEEAFFRDWFAKLSYDDQIRILIHLGALRKLRVGEDYPAKPKTVQPHEGSKKWPCIQEFKLSHLRVYFVEHEGKACIVLLGGGDKREGEDQQDEDILRAAKNWQAYLAQESFKADRKYSHPRAAQSLRATRHRYLLEGCKIVEYKLPIQPEIDSLA